MPRNPGRPQNAIWLEYQKVGTKAQCRRCSKLVSPLTYRMRRHKDGCAFCAAPSPPPPLRPLRCSPIGDRLQPTITFLNKQSAERVHHLLASMVYSLNLPFNAVRNKELKQLMEVASFPPFLPLLPQLPQVLAPGCGVPSAAHIGGKLLDDVYLIERQKLKDRLQNTYQTLSIDGWTGPANRPILGTAIGPHVLGLLDTSGIPHEAQQMRLKVSFT